MSRTLAKAVSPLSVRLTAVERANLQARAGTLTLSAYVKKALFDDTPAVAKVRSSTLADQTLLAHLLATLGGSDLAASLYRLARAADNGSLLADEETTRRIQRQVRSPTPRSDDRWAMLDQPEPMVGYFSGAASTCRCRPA